MDDLFALAAALRVSPTTLLMPNAGDGDEQVAVTGITEECGAERLWKWLHVEEPIEPDDTETLDFRPAALPEWVLLARPVRWAMWCSSDSATVIVDSTGSGPIVASSAWAGPILSTRSRNLAADT